MTSLTSAFKVNKMEVTLQHKKFTLLEEWFSIRASQKLTADNFTSAETKLLNEGTTSSSALQLLEIESALQKLSVLPPLASFENTLLYISQSFNSNSILSTYLPVRAWDELQSKETVVRFRIEPSFTLSEDEIRVLPLSKELNNLKFLQPPAPGKKYYVPHLDVGIKGAELYNTFRQDGATSLKALSLTSMLLET